MIFLDHGTFCFSSMDLGKLIFNAVCSVVYFCSGYHRRWFAWSNQRLGIISPWYIADMLSLLVPGIFQSALVSA